MKKLSLIACILLQAQSSFASTLALDLAAINQLPELKVIEVVRHLDPTQGPKPPTLALEIAYSSCAEQSLIGTTHTQSGVALVTIELAPGSKDCQGAWTERNYRVQVMDDYGGEAVVVLNPQRVEFKP